MARVQSQHGPEKNVCFPLCHPVASLVSKSCSPRGATSQSSRNFVLLVVLALLLAHCRHDPFIVKSAQNLSTDPWFHSACASVSMFTINTDSCLFLFLLLCLCLRVCSLGARSIIGSSPSSCSGVWDPCSVEYHSCKLAILL